MESPQDIALCDKPVVSEEIAFDFTTPHSRICRECLDKVKALWLEYGTEVK